MKSVLRKELASLRRDGRVRLTAALFTALLVGAVTLGVVEQRAFERQRQAAGASDREHWLDQGQKDPHSAAHYGQYVFRPRSSLHWMDRGVDDFLGTTTFLEAHQLSEGRNAAVENRPWAPPFVDLSPSNLVLVILPLVALVLGHSIWNGERVSGTLATTVAAGAEPGRLLRGKVAAVLTVTWALAGIAALVGLIGMLFQQGSFADGLARWGLLTVVYAVSSAIFTLLGVFASAAIRSPARSLLVVLAFWAVAMILVPQVTNSVANQSHPLPDQATVDGWVQDMRTEGIDGNDPRSERRARLRREVFAKYEVSDIKELPVNYSGIALQSGEEYDNRIFDVVRERLDALRRGRARVRQWAYAFSPSAAARALSQLSAGSDEAHHSWFESRAEDRRRSYVKALNDDLAFKSSMAAPKREGSEELWRKTAVGPIAPPALGELVHHAALPGVALLGWTVAALLLFASVWRRAGRDPVALGD